MQVQIAPPLRARLSSYRSILPLRSASTPGSVPLHANPVEQIGEVESVTQRPLRMICAYTSIPKVRTEAPPGTRVRSVLPPPGVWRTRSLTSSGSIFRMEAQPEPLVLQLVGDEAHALTVAQSMRLAVEHNISSDAG